MQFQDHLDIDSLSFFPSMINDPKLIVLSVGGSLIVPETIDAVFLRDFKSLILEHIALGFRFVIICGGGKVCRMYQSVAKETTEITQDDVDWLGIQVTRLNAHLMRTIFDKQAHPKVITNPYQDIQWKESVLVAGGWRPGCSSDWDSVLLAQNLQAKKLVNLSNIDYVYDKDPRTNPDAKRIDAISWSEFRKLIPTEWAPGLNSPFDPIASREAESIGLEVVVMNGKNLANLRSYLKGEKFVGTVIN